MKKLILSLVFVLVTGNALLNATSSNEEYIKTNTETIEVLQDFGCARDCVDRALSVVEPGMDHVDHEILMGIFHNERLLCLKHICGIE